MLIKDSNFKYYVIKCHKHAMKEKAVGTKMIRNQHVKLGQGLSHGLWVWE